MRVAVLWTELPGYMNACLKRLVERHQVELLVYRIANTAQSNKYNFNADLFQWIPELHTLANPSAQQTSEMLARLGQFNPDVIIASGWSVPAYRAVLRAMRKQGVLIIGGCDNSWRNTPKQWLGVATAPYFLHPLFDALWVPGERAGQFAHKLGFSGDKLLYSLYCGDAELFSQAATWRLARCTTNAAWPRRFLFVGRLVKEKGIQDLLAAYREYVALVDDPWELWCAGSGPLVDLVKAEPNVRYLGFIQPDEYLDILKEVGVFILPSHFEPWGVVIHEATAAGLPILCSRQCGSSVELVQEGYNGLRFEAGDIAGLTQTMRHITSSEVDLVAYGKQSLASSEKFSPAQWCANLIGYVNHQKRARPQISMMIR